MLKRTGLSVGYVAGTERNRVFGVDFYKNPKADTKYRILGSAEYKLEAASSKKPRIRPAFTDIISKQKQWVPGSNQFKQTNWKFGAHMPISNVEDHTI